MNEKRNILITGANSGIGLACVKIFVKEGDKVICLVRNKKESSTEILNSLKREGDLDIYYLDLETNDLKNSLKGILNNYKNIDVLINNAGKVLSGLVQMTSNEKFSDLFGLNFFAPLEIIQLTVKKMIRFKKGNIINISSTSAEDCNYGRSAYSTSKAALQTLTKTLAYELGPFNIRANSVLPGLTETKLMRNNTEEAVIKDVLKNIALGRVGLTKEIAELVFFLASEKASYITAQSIRVDGGMN